MTLSNHSVEQDRSWIKACQKGDRFAQHRLYQQYAKAMYHTIYRMTNDVQLSEDLLQDAFIKVFKSLGQFRGESTVGAWIKRIVVNTTITAMRKLHKYSSESIDVIPEGTYQSNQTEESLSVEWIDLAIRQLPEKSRLVFTMVSIEGYKHREIADLLGISESTSKTQYMRAKKILTTMLKPQM